MTSAASYINRAMENSTAVNSDADSYESTLHALLGLTVFYLGFLSLGTTVLNGLVLVTIYKDPLKCLRNPSARFIAGLTSANFLTGLIVEPLFVGLYLWYFSGAAEPEAFYRTVRLAEILAFVTINASFLIILGLAVSQYIGIAYPGLYHSVVSEQKVKIAITCIFFYALFFSLLPEMGVLSYWAFFEADMYLHTTLITVSLVVVYLLMYCKFRQLWGPTHGSEISGSEESEQQRQEMDREFIKGTFILTVFLIVTVCPYAITSFVWMYKSHSSYQDILQTFIAVVICQNIMFLKFLWDPVIFALRLKKYRKSLVFMFGAICRCGERNALPTVSYHVHDSGSAVDEGVENSVI